MNILIISPQRIESEILKNLIDLEPDMNVSGLLSNATDLLEQLHTTPTDLILVESSLMAGLVKTLQAPHMVPALPIIIAYGRQTGLEKEAMAAGKTPYFWKGNGPKALRTMIRRTYLERGNG